MSIRILLADDHTLFRQGLRRVLELEPDFEVVGEAASGEEALAQVGVLKPDVVVLDVSMPGGGLEAAQAIRQRHAQMGIVMLTMHEDAEYLARAIKVGANSYLVKDVDSQHLLEAIRAAREGRPYVHPKLAGLLLQTQLSRPEQNGNPGGLTERELEVLRLVGQGASNKEIAQALFISEKTAKNHLTHIFEKLGVTDRTQAALYAVRAGLVPLKGAK
jgi:two-component system response regulator DegU